MALPNNPFRTKILYKFYAFESTLCYYIGMVHKDEKNILLLALRAGEIMLISGSEIYRVEDTVTRICKAYGIPYVEIFATTTGIFMTLDSGGDSKPYTIIKRIKGIDLDLKKVSLVNDFSRSLVANPIPINEARQMLRQIAKGDNYTFPLQILGSAVAASAFSFIFGGGLREFLCTLVVGGLAYTFAHFLDVRSFNRFFRNFTVCALIGFTALSLEALGIATSVEAMIVGPLMIFVPGLAFTNAMRDSLAGDLLAGGARAMEAGLIALSIAFGVGVALYAWPLIIDAIGGLV